MSKAWRVVTLVLLMYVGIAALHVWLNVGFGKLNLFGGGSARASYRVGYLPVT